MKRLIFLALAILSSSVLCSAVEDRKDIMDRAFITPVRVVLTNGNVTNQDVLLKEGNGQADMAGAPVCSMVYSQVDTASIILDYGRELHGGLKLVLIGKERYPKLVRIRFGESVSETCSEVCDTDWIADHSTDDHAMRDITMKIPRDGSIEIGNTGFRFVRIDLLEKDVTLQIREATAILRYRDIPYVGSFRSSDERLNQIWKTGAYTTHLNMQEYIWDGIKRDRLIWLGDLHPEMSTVAAVFGGNDVINRSIDLACKQYPLPKWLNGMISYSMWYLIIQHDWYMQNGDKAYLEQHRDYITGLVDQFDKGVDEDGTEHLGGAYFLDWPASPNAKGVEAGFRALLCIAMEDAAKLCNVLGDKEHEAKSLAVREKLFRKIKSHNELKQAASLMAMAGLMTPEDACDNVVAVGGGKGFSTFYGYYMLEALAMAGRHQDAIDIIRDFWGSMLDLGATTFWEDFNLDWKINAGRIDEMPQPGKVDVHKAYGGYCYLSYRHSLCHGWASGPTPWLSHHVLGVKIIEPGCKVVKIEPHLGDLEWVEGTYPTPYGVISIRAEKGKDGRIMTKVTKPKQVKLIAGENVRFF